MLSFWSFSFMNTATTKAEALEVEARSLNWIKCTFSRFLEFNSHRRKKKKHNKDTHKKTSDRTTHSAFRKY